MTKAQGWNAATQSMSKLNGQVPSDDARGLELHQQQNRSKYIDSIESIDWEQQYYGNCLKRITIKIQQKIRVPKCGTIKSFRQRFVVIDRTREINFHLGIPQLVASYVLCPYISESIQRLDIWCCSFERFKPTRGVRSMSNEGSHPKFLGAVGPIFFII